MQSVFGHHRIGCKWAREDLARVLAQLTRVLRIAQRGQGANAQPLILGNLQARSQSAQQKRQIGPLRAVEGVQLIDDHVAQDLRRVLCLKLPVRRP